MFRENGSGEEAAKFKAPQEDGRKRPGETTEGQSEKEEIQVYRYKGFTAHTVREGGQLTGEILIKNSTGEKVSEIEVSPTQSIGTAQKAVEVEIERLESQG